MEEEARILLTIPQAAKRLAISTDLAYRLARNGELPSIRLGRSIRVSPEAMDRWVEEQHEAFAKTT